MALRYVKGKGLREKAAYLRSIGAFMIVVKVHSDSITLKDSSPCVSCHKKLKNLGIPIYFSYEVNSKKVPWKHIDYT